MPGHLRIKVKAPFGEVIIEGDSAQEILNILEAMPSEFIGAISNMVSSKLTMPTRAQLEGIVEYTTEGPVITTREKFTHYEAIGLVLYASDEKSSAATHIDRLLQSSGVKAMVPARLNEMTKRGLVFKPNPAQPLYKLTTQGDKWIEEEVLSKLKGRT
ncbi:MAG: hypothetical protein JSV05_09225 [Candidatus Bathyarchaeota archaeon]|nr:MAG: hypothetical protein JSV05_09225 [Candidatus Bathyarchaeota archaeon]